MGNVSRRIDPDKQESVEVQTPADDNETELKITCQNTKSEGL